jgi:hypothetical protein
MLSFEDALKNSGIISLAFSVSTDAGAGEVRKKA